MRKKNALSIRHRSLGAPFVVTAVLAAGCEPAHTNPGPPTNPPAPTDMPVTNPPAPTTTPTTAPVATTTPSATPSNSKLPDAPNDLSGMLVKSADGTCLWVYKPEPMDCPPSASCNPGPPRKPLSVKCPSGPSPKK